ncbi:MAG: hypothetical protein NZ700_15665 [Gemmataceae bacterium]|nr:hypothetical protein [Gemmataceae bacterium]MDW8264017.1 hypothetical protein [Gemmataceae bacterium]
MRRLAAGWLLALAMLLTGLNMFKPVHIDDTVYIRMAEQIARRPCDPYGYTLLWYQYPNRGMDILAPPVLPYWLASVVVWAPDQPAVWKLWMFPFCWLLVWAVDRLFRRFAPGLEAPLVIMTVLSPAVLPGINLMLDMPALALGLTGLVLFLDAARSRSVGRAALAGLVIGLAMQTKYTGFVSLTAVVVYAVVYRRFLLGGLTMSMATGLFVGWEAWVAGQYGVSHFLHNVRMYERAGVWSEKWHLAGPLLSNLGGVGPVVAAFGAAVLARRRWLALPAAAAALLLYLAVMFAPDDWLMITRPGAAGGIHLENLLFGGCGMALVGIVLVTAVRLLGGRWRRPDLFLVAWWLLEVAGYFALTPFPAVRRVLGLVVVSTLLAGRWAIVRRHLWRGWPVHTLAILNVALGGMVALVDWQEAMVQRRAAERSEAIIRARDPHATIWYVGHWGFQFYADRAGMRPVVPWYPASPATADLPPPTLLRRGDWLVHPDPRIHKQEIELPADRLAFLPLLVFGDRLPLRTVICYYGGSVPVQPQRGPRLRVGIAQVTADFWAQSKGP